MFAKNVITRVLTLGAAASTAMVASHAQAQENEMASVERIEVTGSRIKRADMETASPVTVIGAEAILQSGATSIDQVLQKTTAAGGAMSNPGINNGSGGNATINLRGLGSNRTLVLVNGRRMINSGTGAASTVDLNTIPVSMIKRVEVLKDGASAVYGSDAVAGVVNIILKKDFEGFELNTAGSITGEGDGEEVSIDFTMGGSFDKGNVVVGVQYMDRGSIGMADRDTSKCDYREETDENGNLGLVCGGSSYTPYGHIWSGDESLQGEADGGWHDFTNSDRYNYNPESFLYTPMKKLNVTGLGSYEVADYTMMFLETTYSKRWSQQQMAPQPVWFDFTYQDWMGDSLLDYGIEYGDDISYGRRMSDTGPRVFGQNVDTVRVVAGLEGEFDNGWTWDAAITFGRNDSVDTVANLHNMGMIQQDIEAGKFNPLTQDSWAPENASGYVYTELNSGGSEMLNISASLAGELMELPAGYMGFAAGIESRTEKAWFTPDSLTAQGMANDPKQEPTAGEYDVNEAYLELAIPVLADAPLAEHVEISTAVRAFDYSTFGSDATWKLGLTWKVNDELMLRSVASTAFRAPSVDELFGGASPSFNQVDHDASTQSQAIVTVGGNPNLTPEEADTVTFGVVYEPEWFDGLSITADYYDIDITNSITQVSSQYIADQCLGTDGSLINSETALCQSADISIDSTTRISFNNQLQNIGAESTAGVDLNLAYSFVAFDLDWKASLDSTYLSKYEIQATEDAIDYVGIITSGSGGYAKLKSNLSVDVSAADWSAGYQMRYISGMDSYKCLADASSCYAPTTPSVVYHDINGSYHLTDSVTLSAGVNNLFDKAAPYYTGNNDANTDAYTYDTKGRTFFARATVKF
ncbi:TonB-dependent receptor [Thalassotalea ponticola]|uniref:TonB-dependent receptor n=1 Tax=Thalassotalea ponticola TaxID=1523392 RepID=UPI0025B4A682|nr:TonB-dependent receptor [Thalassotalea ponticola]MDN3653629.1 TonB-dependent receptor [Thalassotalea ponticola]